jgi:hypothetical protein
MKRKVTKSLLIAFSLLFLTVNAYATEEEILNSSSVTTGNGSNFKFVPYFKYGVPGWALNVSHEKSMEIANALDMFATQHNMLGKLTTALSGMIRDLDRTTGNGFAFNGLFGFIPTLWVNTETEM